jgi:hypothetical protein
VTEEHRSRADQPRDTDSRRKFLTRGRVVSLSLVAGVTVSFASWSLRDIDPWWSATFSNVAFAAFLLVPGELALTWLTSRFQRVERATDAVRETAEVAKETADRAERSIEDVREKLLARQTAEYDAELDVYRKLERDLSRSAVINALRQATDGELITERVPVWETNLHYRFLLDGPVEELIVQLESDDGTIVSSHPWRAANSVDDFFQVLISAVRSAGADLGVGLNDPTQSVQDLSEMLVQVARHRSQALMGYRDYLYKIIERRDGWYFTESGVLPENNLRYEVPRSRLHEAFWEEHLHGKGWDGATYALHFARSLYGISTTPDWPEDLETDDDAAI